MHPLRLTGQIKKLAATPTSLVIASHITSSGTHGGTSTAGSWQTFPINTLEYDSSGLASIGSNQITGLRTGRYVIEGFRIIVAPGAVILRLQNITDATTTVIFATPHHPVDPYFGGATISLFSIPVVIDSAKYYELQYYATYGVATYGVGVDKGSGINNVFSRMIFRGLT